LTWWWWGQKFMGAWREYGGLMKTFSGFVNRCTKSEAFMSYSGVRAFSGVCGCYARGYTILSECVESSGMKQVVGGLTED
jgi:hypothetical protein